MRDYSKVSPRVWESEKYWSLESDLHRYAYHYLLTCAHVNSCGCYKLPISYMADDLKWDLEASRKAIESLCHSLLIAYDKANRTVWITRWFDFNPPTNPNHGKSILSQIDKISSPSLKIQCLDGLKEFMEQRGFKDSRTFLLEIERLSKAYRKTIATETVTETQTKTETQTETKPKLKQISAEQVSGQHQAQQAAGEPEGPPPVAQHGVGKIEPPDIPKCLDRRPKPVETLSPLLQTAAMRRTENLDADDVPDTKPMRGKMV